MNSLMNILISTDIRYLDITKTMLFSLSENVSRPLSIWCLESRLADENKASFRQFLNDKCHIYDLVFVDMAWLTAHDSSLPLTIRHISFETYYRLFAQFVLPPAMDRILWLDSDIIVKGPIEELYDHDINDAPFLAFPNMGESVTWGNAARLGLPDGYTYFNAGVMLLNLTYLRNHTSIDDLLTFCTRHKTAFKQQDQDALNLLYYHDAKIVNDQRFNCMVNAPNSFSSPTIVYDAAIIHYAGWQKPWKVKWQNAYSKYWWDTKRKIGLAIHDYFILGFGTLLKVIQFNTLERWFLSPYHWLKARLKTDR